MNRDEMKKDLLEKYGIQMWPEEKIVAFRKALLDWYDAEGRDHLPWRMNQDPYRIWVSEIMLQQTRVVTVIPYYNRFMSLFPTIEALATAEEDVLLKAWEGLGYYSRVRNLQTAARQIMEEYAGVFPSNVEDIHKLKGIGPYTAGAIASMAFQLPEPAVDGNVMRVFSRLFEIDADIAKPATRKIFELVVRLVIDPDRPGDFNQAIMDLGTDICGPVNPRPEESPVKEFNAAYLNETMAKYPVKSKAKKPTPLTLQGIVVQYEDCFLFEKRPDSGLLKGFWTFPLLEEEWPVEPVQPTLFDVEGEPLESVIRKWAEKNQLVVTHVHPSIGSFTHVFSHRKWEVTVHYIQVSSPYSFQATDRRWVPFEEFEEIAFAVPQQKIWEIARKHQGDFR